MYKLKRERVAKTLSLGLIGVLSIGLVLSNTNITSSAHNTYFLGVTIDQSSGNYKYMPTVIYEENGNMSADNHREAQIGDFSAISNTNGTYKDFKMPEVSNELDSDKAEEAYKNLVSDGNGDKGLQFTFPGLHGRDGFVEKVNANGLDQDVANFMAEHLVGDLNEAISFVITNSSIRTNKSYSANSYRDMVIKLANSAQTAYTGGSSSFSVENTTFKVTKGTDATAKSIDDNYCKSGDYVVLTAPNGAVTSCLYRANKGYFTQRNDLSKKYLDSMKKDKWAVADELNWKMIILQGNYLADVKKITFASVNEIVKPSSMSLAIGEFFGGMLSGLRNLLGLYPLNDVFLNTGTRNTNYYYGLMPKSWMSSAMLLHIICQVIAWSVVGFAIVKNLLKRQLQTMNIGERISLMEGLKDLLITGFSLGAFALIFNILARTNYALVGVFGSSSSLSQQMGTTTTMSTGMFATIIINFAFFIVNVYFNFVYILRAFTIALLYGIAPIAIVCIAFGGKYKQIFDSYIKEIIANIFLQTFHAICVALFTNITSTTQLKTFELFVLLVGFIPLTKFVRQSILGLPSGITDEASRATGMAVGGATALAGGLFAGAGAMSGKGSNSSSSSGKNSTSGGNNSGPVNNKIQSAINSKAPVQTEKASTLKQGATSIQNMITGATNKAGNKTTSNNDLMSSMNENGNMSDTNTSNNSKVLASNNGFSSPKNAREKVKELAKMPSASTMKGVANGVAKASMGVAQLGLALGSGAIGDDKTMGNMLRQSSNNFSNATNSANNTEQGSNSFNDTANAHGGKQLYDSGESSTIVYDTDTNGEFNDSALADSDYGQNFKEMYQAFSGTGDYGQDGSKSSYRKEAVNYYKSQGYQGIGYYEKGQGMAVKINKDVMQKKGYDFRANPIPYNPTKFKSNENPNNNNNNTNTNNTNGNSNRTTNQPKTTIGNTAEDYTKTNSGIYIKK